MPRAISSVPRHARAARRALSPVDQLLVAGARQLVARTHAIGARTLIAGIGHAFFAARIAQLQLARAGFDLAVLVETGLYHVECGRGGHGFPLAYDNLARAHRLTSVDDILGVVGCGADNRCLAALGAAQIDRRGNLNSTRLPGGQVLVGSGGACDIAASVEEVVVLMRFEPGRLVERVDYVTSPGRAVRSVVTDRGVLLRAPDGWLVQSLPPAAGATLAEEAARLRGDCAWPLADAPDLAFDPSITVEEARLLDELDPAGLYRRRAA
jgi:hypothetical protein